MDRPRDYHTKQSKSERESQISHDIIYTCDLKKKNDTNELISKQK